MQFLTHQLTRDEEHACGADWEWFIGNARRGWYRFLVQAKKLDPVKGTYPELQRADRRERQIAALRAAAAAATKNPKEARPTLLYVLYNGIPSPDPSRSADAQFGVAVLPVKAIEELAKGQQFTFDTVRAETRPWRDMVCFDRLQTFAGEEPARELPPRIGVSSTTVARKRQGADVSPDNPGKRTFYARYTVAIEIGTTATGEQPSGPTFRGARSPGLRFRRVSLPGDCEQTNRLDRHPGHGPRGRAGRLLSQVVEDRATRGQPDHCHS